MRSVGGGGSVGPGNGIQSRSLCISLDDLDAQGPASLVRRGSLYRVYKTINPDREQDEVGEDEGRNDEVPDR